MDILRVCIGNRTKVYVNGKEEKEWVKEERLIGESLYSIFYELCEEEN